MRTMTQTARLLGVDDKTLARWLRDAGEYDQLERDPVDRRLRYVPDPIIQRIATAHRRALPPEWEAGTAGALVTAGGPVAALVSLQRQITALTARLDALERRGVSVPRPDAQPYTSASESPYSASLVQHRVPHAARVRITGPAGSPFTTRADAARWLLRHGINSPGTPKSWPGWEDVRLTPDAVLRLAKRLQDEADAEGNWRRSWRLSRCDDASCVCRELLGEAPSNDSPE